MWILTGNLTRMITSLVWALWWPYFSGETYLSAFDSQVNLINTSFSLWAKQVSITGEPLSNNVRVRLVLPPDNAFKMFYTIEQTSINWLPPSFLIFCLISLMTWSWPLSFLLTRYCMRAKRIFSELHEQPHVVELDLRGISNHHFLISIVLFIELNYLEL